MIVLHHGGADPDGPVALQNELREMGVRCESMEIDLSIVSAPRSILDEVETRLGNRSILVNNAAYSTSDGYEVLDGQIFDAHYVVNVGGTLFLSAEFARRFPGQWGAR